MLLPTENRPIGDADEYMNYLLVVQVFVRIPISISTAATNHAGRMAARDAKCYLGSPATVAASAVTGRITDPREMLEKL